MKHRRLARGIIVVLGVAFPIWAPLVSASSVAHAQGAAKDQSGTLSATGDQKSKSWLEQRFGSSFAELTTYIGSGTFYEGGGYNNSYVSTALYLRPTYQLGTKYGLTLNGRIYLEEEYTQPDTSTGRRFYPLDTWVFLSAKNLYTEPRSKIRFSGTLRTVWPTSYESRYAHLITGVGVGGSANRGFEFGRPDAKGKRWELALTFGSVFTKFLRSSSVRGNGPGDSTGCRTTGPAGGGLDAGGQPTGASSDRCGGPLSTSFSVMTSGSASLQRGRWSLSTTLILINEFRYSFDADAFMAAGAVPMGRADWTWGIVAAGYQLTEKVSFSLGFASYQPALDSRYQDVRFPFFDFAGPNANNFTQVFAGVTGTL